MLGEPFDEVKQSKFREIRSLQALGNWNVMIDECGRIEKALIELCHLFSEYNG